MTSDERREWVANIIDEYFMVMSREDLDYLMEFADERRERVLKYADCILALLDEEERGPVAWAGHLDDNAVSRYAGLPVPPVKTEHHTMPLYRSPEPAGEGEMESDDEWIGRLISFLRGHAHVHDPLSQERDQIEEYIKRLNDIRRTPESEEADEALNMKIDPATDYDNVDTSVLCAKPECTETFTHRHHKRHQRLFIGAWTLTKHPIIQSDRFKRFRRTYNEFRLEDCVRICPAHHVEIHNLYQGVITDDISSRKKRLNSYSWEDAHELMDKLEELCNEWLKEVTPGFQLPEEEEDE